jgi:glucosamine--fructose-6-phosphate aminotransferase (isomerizing)
MHGPIALVERAFPVFLFVPPGPTLESSVSTLRKLKELEAETIVITQASYKDIRLMATRSIGLPGKPVGAGGGPEDLMTPAPYIIPAQLFAAFLAEQKGLDPDHPRTLSKVTKTI